MARGLKLGLGIPMVLVGLGLTFAGIVLLVLVGPDGRFSLPENEARSDVRALVFDGLSIGGVPESGGFAVAVDIRVRDLDGADQVFVGIGQRVDVERYLEDVAADRLIQANWPGGVRTERVEGPGFRVPPPPAEEDFWATADVDEDAAISWPASDGEWVVVVMNADASAGIAAAGSVDVTIPALGPVSIVVAVLGVAVLVGGVALTVSGARMPSRPAGAGRPPARPDAA
ncbi:MAG TPA: hypothetical protein VF235_07935 [Actinomycetota bacterium]